MTVSSIHTRPGSGRRAPLASAALALALAALTGCGPDAPAAAPPNTADADTATYTLAEVEEHAGRPGHTPSVWLMLPTANQGLPLIDGVAVPIVNNMQNTRALALPQAWVENRHRAGVAT